MDWIKILVKLGCCLLYMSIIVQGASVWHKGDQIQATFSAKVDHGSLENGEHNATSAISGSVQAQVSTVKGRSLEQLFQRIGDVLSKMVVNAGGSIVPSIHDDTGRNRVELNVSVTAEQHNNVSSSLRPRPQDKRASGTQHEAPRENYSTSLEDDSSETRSPATSWRAERTHQKHELSPGAECAKTKPDLEEESTLSLDSSPQSLIHQQPPTLDQSESHEEVQLSSVDETQIRPTTTLDQSEALEEVQLSSVEETQIHSDEQQSSRTPASSLETHAASFDSYVPSETDLNGQIQPMLMPMGETVLLDEEQNLQPTEDETDYFYRQRTDDTKTEEGSQQPYSHKNFEVQTTPDFEDHEPYKSDITPMVPFSDYPHVHNGNNYAELPVLNENTPTYVTHSGRDYNSSFPRLLGQGLLPFNPPQRYDTEEDNPGRNSDKHAYASNFGQPFRKDSVGVGSPSVKQTLTVDNTSPVVMSEENPTDESNLYFKPSFSHTGTFTTGGGRNLRNYFDNTQIFPADTDGPLHPHREMTGSFASQADFQNNFKQDLAGTINDIGFKNNEGGPNNAFFNRAEEESYFPSARETRYNSKTDSETPAVPREDIAPAEEVPLEGEQPASLSATRIEMATGNAETSKNTKFGTATALLSAVSPTTSSRPALVATGTATATGTINSGGGSADAHATHTASNSDIVTSCLQPDFDIPDSDPYRLKNIDVLRAILFREFLHNLKYSHSSKVK